MEIYFDNAATTAIDLKVLETLLPYLTDIHGNPSSAHRQGRLARQAIEKARQTVADHLEASPEEIFFTSGATEANNLVLSGSIHTFHIRHFITSPLEHHSVLRCLEHYRKNDLIRVSLVETDAEGQLNLHHLDYLLKKNPASFVSLMHANNEIGNRNPVEEIADICRVHKALFHSDTVQTIGKERLRLRQVPIHFAVGSAHKFHGPKGIGFLYADKRLRLKPQVHGGSQERDLRAGTENVAGIVGLAEALSLAYQHRESVQAHLQHLKTYCVEQLKAAFGQVSFNGASGDPSRSVAHVLNVCLPALSDGTSLVDLLDQRNIAVSGGSACSNLHHKGSHVLKALAQPAASENVRLSFSKYNTLTEIDYLVRELQDIYSQNSGQAVLAVAS